MFEKRYHNILVKYHCSEYELKETHIIYILKFPNEKYYVGQTNSKRGLEERIQGHCYEPFKNKNRKFNEYKNNIVRKYKTFDVFIAHKCDITNIDDFERFYISILRRKVINLESGGCTLKTHSQKTIEKLKTIQNKYQQEHPTINVVNVYDLQGNFIREHQTLREMEKYYNVSKTIINNSLYKENRKFLGIYQIYRKGKEKIVDYTKKIRKPTKKRGAKNPNEIVYKYDAKTGIFIDIFEIGKIPYQKRAFLKRAIQANALYDGFAWSFEKHESIIPPKARYEKVSEKLSRPVLQLNDKLEIINKWQNVRKAGEFYNASAESIRLVCMRWRRHCKKFVWCYEDEYEWFKTMWNEKLVNKH